MSLAQTAFAHPLPLGQMDHLHHKGVLGRPEVEAGEGPIPSWPCRRADVLRLLLEKLLLLKILLRRHGLPVDGHGRCEGERVGADELEWRYVEGERVGADGPGWRCVVSGCRYEAGRDPCGSDTNVVKRDREEDE
jgi:hypothetical protein